jgi:hypothetical protein
MRRVHTLLLPLLLAAALLFTPSPALAQQQKQGAAPQKQIEIPADGFQLFRGLLDRAGIKPITRQEFDRGWLNRWDDVIVIVVGDPAGRMNNVNAISFVHTSVNNGGAGFVAADSYVHLGVTLMQNLGGQDSAKIESGRVECKDPRSVHTVKLDGGGMESMPSCPYVVPVPLNGASPLSKIFAGLNHVATNEPSYLRVSGFSGEFRYALARFPKQSVLIDNQLGNRRVRPLPDDALFAIGGDGPDGNNQSSYRFLAMADHSVFINQMLIEPGTDNLELTYRTIEYLQGPNKRRRCLFIENGSVVEKFDELAQAFRQSRPSPPIPNLDKMQQKLTDFGNELADRLQTNNVPNKMLLAIASLPAIMRFFLVVAAIYSTWYLMRRLFTVRKPTDIPQPPSVAAAATGPPGVFERRQKELIRRDNLYEPIRDLVRDYFATVGIHGTQHGPKVPKLVISDMVRKPESLKLAIKDFWRLAFGPPQEVTVRRWREMEPYFERLQQAHADGKWRFVLADAPVAVTV